MRYLITTKNESPFLADCFDSENNFNQTSEMVVYDLAKNIYTKDGVNWEEIEIDHL